MILLYYVLSGLTGILVGLEFMCLYLLLEKVLDYGQKKVLRLTWRRIYSDNLSTNAKIDAKVEKFCIDMADRQGRIITCIATPQRYIDAGENLMREEKAKQDRETK
jgi:hypothetical protein